MRFTVLTARLASLIVVLIAVLIVALTAVIAALSKLEVLNYPGGSPFKPSSGLSFNYSRSVHLSDNP